MAIKEVTGHLLNIGDKVKMNLSALAEGDLDGVEITNSGNNYWRYMNEHPDEVYTVVDLDFANDPSPCIYKLSGAMAGSSWAADELIHIPEASSMFEVMKNLEREEAPGFILFMMQQLCADGLPSVESVSQWLDSR